MGIEIERKFLVLDDRWRSGSPSTTIRQGYLSRSPERTVRVRVAGDRAWLTIKAPGKGIARPEYEYEIPAADGAELLGICDGPLVEKVRHLVPYGGQTWEVDVFHGQNEGLIVAELELDNPDQGFDRPPWLGEEVTEDRRYANSQLAVHPFRTWKND